MKTPNVGDVVTVISFGGRATRATVRRSYKRRFIVMMDVVLSGGYSLSDAISSFERTDEGKTWVRGWDDETAVAFRAEIALAACR